MPIDVSMFKSIPTQLLNSPHNQNPGSLVNSATEPINKPQEKEEPEMAAPENKITTVDALKAAYPDLVATIQNEAAATERARIKGIEDLANGNYDAIAKDAKFDNPISAQEMAVKIISEQNKDGRQLHSEPPAGRRKRRCKQRAGSRTGGQRRRERQERV